MELSESGADDHQELDDFKDVGLPAAPDWKLVKTEPMGQITMYEFERPGSRCPVLY